MKDVFVCNFYIFETLLAHFSKEDQKANNNE